MYSTKKIPPHKFLAFYLTTAPCLSLTPERWRPPTPAPSPGATGQARQEELAEAPSWLANVK